MNETGRTITKLYLIGSVWFLVMLAAAAASILLLSGIYTALDLSAVGRTFATMTTAIVAASTAAAIVWARVRPAHETSAAGQGPGADRDGEEDHSATLAAIR